MERSSAPIRRLHVFARDSKADGYCAETWVDYTTSPHRHYDPYLVFACGNGKAGYGPEFTTNHDNPNGFRMAVCKARTRNSKPEGCKLWNTDNNFAVEAWQHGKYKKFEAR
ncbi:hypothetical protein [Streptomyces boninensis]|uniref:hypothetical protein n=1 Tax=Streptomyces boninensis TaxID=2039455 RepID=UPI003B21591B